MPFTSYAWVQDVALAHRIRVSPAEFLTPVPTRLSDYFREELDFNLREVPYRRSEAGACENLIYPMLREVWKPHRDALTLWSHEALDYDADLCGVVDYLVTRRSPLGAFVRDMPYLLVVEAKRDDFERGWSQCLAAMLAAQKLNDQPETTLFGIATNGRGWEFGRLEGDLFTQDTRTYALSTLDDLAAAINGVMVLCREQAARQPATA